MIPTRQNDRVSSIPSIELIAQNGTGIYVSCQFRVDRFEQEIGLVADTKRIPVLFSCEGGSEDVWPASPPLQQVHYQEIDDGPVLLGVGMSGASHYSTSILLKNEAGTIELQVESACVAKQQVSDSEMFLGSRLLPDRNVNVSTNQAGESLFLRQDWLPGILLSCDGTVCRLQQPGSDQIEITPLKIQQPGTTQWSYRLRFENPETR